MTLLRVIIIIEAASMYHVVHLIHVFFAAERRRSLELCKRENKACLQDKLTRYSFKNT